MYVDTASRRFNSEFSALLDKHVAIRMTNGQSVEGTLLGYESSRYSIILGNAKVPSGEAYPRLVIYGHVIAEIRLTEPPLDVEELAKRLEEAFPKMVKYYPEARLITVMDRVRVTERGVEGTGPIAERVKAFFERFLEEWKARHKLT